MANLISMLKIANLLNNKKHNALRRFGLQKYYKERSNADR